MSIQAQVLIGLGLLLLSNAVSTDAADGKLTRREVRRITPDGGTEETQASLPKEDVQGSLMRRVKESPEDSRHYLMQVDAGGDTMGSDDEVVSSVEMDADQATSFQKTSSGYCGGTIGTGRKELSDQSLQNCADAVAADAQCSNTFYHGHYHGHRVCGCVMAGKTCQTVSSSVLDIYVIEATTEGVTCHFTSCGRAGICPSDKQSTCAAHSERFNVRCCSETHSGWRKYQDRVLPNGDQCPYTESDNFAPDANKRPCQRSKTYDEANDFCTSVGARLCTVAEAEADCLRGTGCGHDRTLIWTSDEGTITEAAAPTTAAPTTTEAPSFNYTYFENNRAHPCGMTLHMGMWFNIEDDAVCRDAGVTLHKTFVGVGSWAHIQPGCVSRTNGRMWFNTNSMGDPNQDYSNICKKACWDTDNGASTTDSTRHMSCALYTGSPEYCGYYDGDANFDSGRMCCSCGGGSLQAVEVFNAPAADGTCTDPDPSMAGDGDYACPTGYSVKRTPTGYGVCTNAETCNANCCEALAPVCSDLVGALSSPYPCKCGVTTRTTVQCASTQLCSATDDFDGVCQATDGYTKIGNGFCRGPPPFTQNSYTMISSNGPSDCRNKCTESISCVAIQVKTHNGECRLFAKAPAYVLARAEVCEEVRVPGRQGQCGAIECWSKASWSNRVWPTCSVVSCTRAISFRYHCRCPNNNCCTNDNNNNNNCCTGLSPTTVTTEATTAQATTAAPTTVAPTTTQASYEITTAEKFMNNPWSQRISVSSSAGSMEECANLFKAKTECKGLEFNYCNSGGCNCLGSGTPSLVDSASCNMGKLKAEATTTVPTTVAPTTTQAPCENKWPFCNHHFCDGNNLERQCQKFCGACGEATCDSYTNENTCSRQSLCVWNGPMSMCQACATDSDVCLQQSWGYSGSRAVSFNAYRCKSSLPFCLTHPKDMYRCCPQTCAVDPVCTALACHALSSWQGHETMDGGGECIYPNPALTTQEEYGYVHIGNGWCMDASDTRINDEPSPSWNSKTIRPDGSAEYCETACRTDASCIGYMTRDGNSCSIIRSTDSNAATGIHGFDPDGKDRWNRQSEQTGIHCWKRQAEQFVYDFSNGRCPYSGYLQESGYLQGWQGIEACKTRCEDTATCAFVSFCASGQGGCNWDNRSLAGGGMGSQSNLCALFSSCDSTMIVSDGEFGWETWKKKAVEVFNAPAATTAPTTVAPATVAPTTGAPTPTQATTEGVTCHFTSCGRAGVCSSDKQSTCAAHSERFNVRCCSERQISRWRKHQDRVLPNGDQCPYTESDNFAPDANKQPCLRSKTYDEANDFCTSVDARLCTVAEAEADCLRGTGCGHDNTLIWTSDEGTITEALAQDVMYNGDNTVSTIGSQGLNADAPTTSGNRLMQDAGASDDAISGDVNEDVSGYASQSAAHIKAGQTYE